VLRKRNRIIGRIGSQYWVRTHKFGVKIPKNVTQAVLFDKDNGNTLWRDAICEEMKNVRPALEVWEKDISDLPPGYQEIAWHMIFDVKMGENFLYFKLKDDRIAEMYLGAAVSKMSLDNGKWCWTMSPKTYVKSAVTDVEEHLARSGRRLPGNAPHSRVNYASWLEATAELILLEISLLSTYLQCENPKRKLGFDPSHPEIDETDNDGVPDCDDECLKDSNKSLPVRVAVEKQKHNLIATIIPDRIDECPRDCEKNVPVVCGCRIVDSNSDLDNDGFLDYLTTIDKTVPGLCPYGEVWLRRSRYGLRQQRCLRR
jgi:hypothetical protein